MGRTVIVRVRQTVLILMIGLSLAGPACADWQYTRWGMTPEDVARAAGNAAVSTSAEEIKKWRHGDLTPLNKAAYRTDKFRFTAIFYYTPERRLQEVALQLEDGDARELLFAMRDRYGAPVREQLEGLLQFMVWELPDEIVRFVQVVNGPPTVEYATRRTARAKGL